MEKRRILALLLALALSVSLLAGCQSRDDAETPDEEESLSSIETVVDDSRTVADVTPDFLENVEEKQEENEDTVGWLQVPGTLVDDVVVCNFEDNNYYLRLDFNKNYNYNGVFYADRRSEFGDGSRDQLGMLTTIYGHSLTDDEERETYDIQFGTLHNLRDPEIAKDVPYIFFSTPTENLAFEIFSIFIANADNPDLPYNRNDLEREEYLTMVREEILPRSIYDYGIEIQDDDKFVALSTCIYVLPDGTSTNYPNTFYRYVIMARLVDPDEPLKTQAGFEINEDHVMDPHGGPMGSAR